MRDRLVTLVGGGGFVGRYVAQALFETGARVRIVQRDPRRAWFLKPLGNLGQTQFVAADIRRPEAMERAVAGSDAVVNLVGVLAGDLDAVHVRGAANVARAAAATGADALVHVSALGADADSASAYGRSKAAGEAAVREAFPAATILRPSTMFGREDQFINRLAAMIAWMPVVPVIRPAARLQPVDVSDVAAAAGAALREPARYGGRTFELGGPDVLSMAELVRWIARATGRNPAIVDLPDSVGGLIAALGFLPGAPITADQWRMLGEGSTVAPGAAGLEAFGITPTPLAATAPAWLVRYRRNGRFGNKAEATPA